jgi:hypothetical protein
MLPELDMACLFSAFVLMRHIHIIIAGCIIAQKKWRNIDIEYA